MNQNAPIIESLREPLLVLDRVTKSFALEQQTGGSLKEHLIGATLAIPRWLMGKRAASRSLDQSQAPRQTVFRDLSFSIHPGDFVGIIGQNGAGKSTILKIISGIYYPDSGNIKIRGNIAPLLELGAGFTDQLTGMDNICLNSAILGMSAAELKENIQSIIDFSELGDRLHLPIRHYSSGMIVRLSFAIAVHLNAQILLFDEVLAVGDQSFQEKCIEKIKQLHSSGKAVILVTHSQEIIKTYCNRCIIIGNQQKLFDGPPSAAINFYQQQQSRHT